MKQAAALNLILLIAALWSLTACDVQEGAVPTRPAPPTAPAAPPVAIAPLPAAALPAAPTAETAVFPTSTPQPTPAPERTLEVFHSGPVMTLDPGYATAADEMRITRLLFDGLVQFQGGSSAVEPALAERWQVSSDGRRWTFMLRQGVTFHDGTPFNADAVLFSYRRLIDRSSPYYRVGGDSSPFRRLLGGEIRALRKLDTHTVIFDLWRPFAPFLTYLAASSAGIVSPAAVGRWHSDFAINPVGTGPYRLQALDPDRAVTVTASIGFWGKPAPLSAIIFRRVSDAPQRLALLREGGGGVIAGASPADLAALAKDRRFTRFETPGANLSWVLMNPAKAPELADIRVRRAILQAVDVQAIVAGAWGGAAQRAINPFPESMPCWNRLVRPYDHDPARARALLREAGYPAGFALTLDYSKTPRPYMPNPATVAEAVAKDLAAVGITVTLRAHPWQELAALADRRELGFQLFGWYDLPEPDLFMRQMLLKEPYSRGDFASPMAALAERAAESYNQQERCAIYGQMQQIFHDSAERIPLAHAQYIDAVATRVEGYILGADGVQNLRGVTLR